MEEEPYINNVKEYSGDGDGGMGVSGILTRVSGMVKRQRQKSEAARLAMKTFLAEQRDALKIKYGGTLSFLKTELYILKEE